MRTNRSSTLFSLDRINLFAPITKMDGTRLKMNEKTNEANCELIAEFAFLTGLVLTANKITVDGL